jgi:hypothetical protein
LKELIKSNIQGLINRGVYKIYFYVNDKPFSVNRILKCDMSGLFYIGCTNKQNFEKRLNNFILSSEKVKTNNHSGGNKISINDNLKKLISTGKLMFEIIEFDNPLEEERKMIDQYFDEFGEKPPLNG